MSWTLFFQIMALVGMTLIGIDDTIKKAIKLWRSEK